MQTNSICNAVDTDCHCLTIGVTYSLQLVSVTEAAKSIAILQRKIRGCDWSKLRHLTFTKNALLPGWALLRHVTTPTPILIVIATSC